MQQKDFWDVHGIIILFHYQPVLKPSRYLFLGSIADYVILNSKIFGSSASFGLRNHFSFNCANLPNSQKVSNFDISKTF
jgi:hypothetical protein